MASPNISITVELEPIVKLLCVAITCKHNLMNAQLAQERQAACELKHLVISHDGKCTRYEPEEGKNE